MHRILIAALAATALLPALPVHAADAAGIRVEETARLHALRRIPYASTYRAISSPPVWIQGATVLTGTGTRLDGADVLMRDGKIVAVGMNLDVPADALRVDGRGRWVTPGVIDVHSHLGVYAQPGRESASRRQRGHRGHHAQRVGRAFGMAAGSGLREGAGRRRDLDADPAGFGESDRRPWRDVEECVGHDLSGR